MTNIKPDKRKVQMRISDSELSLIKSTFAENEELLKIIRKVFLQIELSKSESAIFASAVVKHEEVTNLIRKVMLPEIVGDEPLFQVIDLWYSLEVKDKSIDMAYPQILSREALIKYVTQQVDSFAGKKAGKDWISFADMTVIANKSEVQVFVDLLTRNTIITHVQQQLGQLLVLAGQKEETVEETKLKLQRDSSK